jgi:hypothetical protein
MTKAVIISSHAGDRAQRLARSITQAFVASIGMGSMLGTAAAQDSVPPPPFVAPQDCAPRRGPIARCVARLKTHVHEDFVGQPQFFDEPPLGAALYQNMGRMKNKADVHTFTLYRSDFIAGEPVLSPSGMRRLSFMSPRLSAWPGPVVIEWTPETPALAEARRYTVLAALQGASAPVPSERVVIGPSAYRGLMGPDAGNNHDALIFRDYTAPRSFSVTPTSTADFGGGAR